MAAAVILNIDTANANSTKHSIKTGPDKDSLSYKKVNIHTTDFVYYGGLFNTSELIKSNMMPTKLAGEILSSSHELGPIVSSDGKTLYFSRHQHPENTAGENDEEDIWYSKWDEENNKWGDAKNMGAPLNNEHPNFINWVSPDGNTIVLGNTYFTNGKMGSGLSVSHLTSEGWEFPKNMIIEGKKKQPVISACHLSSDQKILLFACENGKNSKGAEDIYVSFLTEDNHWSKPLNLGSGINTNGYETAPFIAEDGRTLYFTSDGLSGYGGSDIYVTTRLDDSWQNWSEPQNLGPKVNTTTDQSFFSISNNSVYFSSESEEGNTDLFTLVLPKAEKIVLEGDLSSGLNEVTTSEISDITLYTILFDFDKNDLTQEKMEMLNLVAKRLMESPNLQLEIDGHTDNIGSAAYNEHLSQKRIDAISMYLKHHFEIDEKRIVTKNYGETMPVTTNETKEGRRLNRRVELTLIKSFRN